MPDNYALFSENDGKAIAQAVRRVNGIKGEVGQTLTDTLLTGVVLIPVTLSQTGGSNGSATAACSWTYTATHRINTAKTWTGLSPETTNRFYGDVKKATIGLIWMSGTTPKLIYCDEIPNGGNCST